MDKNLTTIGIDSIRVGENALRLIDKDEAFYALVQSIRNVGVLCPVLCIQQDKEVLLVAGHRRVAAAKEAGLTEIPAVVQDGIEDKQKEIAFAENMIRKDLSPVEIAAGIKDCVKKDKMTVEKVARIFHKSQTWVRRQLEILDWPTEILKAVHEQKIKTSAAANLAVIPDQEYRDYLLRNAIENGATARTTAAWLQAYRSSMPYTEASKLEPEDQETYASPALPQAPCLCCQRLFPPDGMAMVMVCTDCVREIRQAQSR